MVTVKSNAEVRYRVITVDPLYLENLLTCGVLLRYPTTSNVPKDVRVVDAKWDRSRGVLKLLVESAEFEPVTLFDIIPKFDAVFATGDGR